MNFLSKAKKNLDGKKTYISGALAMAFDISNELFPNLMSVEKELVIQKILFYLIYYGVLDKVWRNKKDIFEFVKNIFSSKK